MAVRPGEDPRDLEKVLRLRAGEGIVLRRIATTSMTFNRGNTVSAAMSASATTSSRRRSFSSRCAAVSAASRSGAPTTTT